VKPFDDAFVIIIVSLYLIIVILRILATVTISLRVLLKAEHFSFKTDTIIMIGGR